MTGGWSIRTRPIMSNGISIFELNQFQGYLEEPHKSVCLRIIKWEVRCTENDNHNTKISGLKT